MWFSEHLVSLFHNDAKESLADSGSNPGSGGLKSTHVVRVLKLMG